MRVFNQHCPSLKVDLRFKEAKILDEYFERLESLGIKPFMELTHPRQDIEIISVTSSEVEIPAEISSELEIVPYNGTFGNIEDHIMQLTNDELPEINDDDFELPDIEYARQCQNYQISALMSNFGNVLQITARDAEFQYEHEDDGLDDEPSFTNTVSLFK